MCVGCLVISTLSFIVPVSEAPALNVPQPVTASVLTTQAPAQISPGIVAVEAEIQTVLAQLPDSEDAEMLKSGLETALVKLDTATSDQHAQAILDEEIDTLAEALTEAPNASQVSNILLDIRDQQDVNNLQTETNSVQLQSNAGFTLLQKGLQLNQHSGWLA